MQPDLELAAALEEASGALAARLTERHFARWPELAARFGAAGRQRCEEDARFHLRYLAQTFALGIPELFGRYLAWAVPMLASRKVPKTDLRADMEELRALLAEEFPHALAAIDAAMIPALARVESEPEQVALTPLSAAAQAYFEAAQDEGPRAIADFACMREARVLALSASITPHLGALREAIALVRADPRCAGMKVLVGGAAFSGLPALWRSVGADSWAPDAAAAIAEVHRLTS